MSETPGQRMFRQLQEMRDAFPNGFGILDGVKADIAEKDATIAALRTEVEQWRDVAMRNERAFTSAEAERVRFQRRLVEIGTLVYNAGPDVVDGLATLEDLEQLVRDLYKVLNHD